MLAQREGHPPTSSKRSRYPPPLPKVGRPQRRVCIIDRGGVPLELAGFAGGVVVITDDVGGGVRFLPMAAYVWVMNDAKSFSFIVGESGSGKTTMINALCCMSNPRWHVLTIEEVRELAIPHFWNEHLVTRSSPQLARSEYDIDIMGLGMAALRKKPH